MSVTISIDNKEMTEMMNRFSEFAQKSVPQLVRAHARLCAVELANRTQPFSVGKGAGDEAKSKGTKRVAKDVGWVVKKDDTINRMIDHVNTVSIRDRLTLLMSSGRMDAVAKIFERIGFFKSWGGFDELKGSSSVKDKHKTGRNKTTGRSFSKQAKLFHSTESTVDKYAEIVSKRVGMSKSGWADCARKIGGLKGDGARGIPAFAKRHKGNGEIVDNTGDKSDPNIVMKNTIPWASRVCPVEQQSKAVQITQDKMKISFQKAMDYAAKKGTYMEKVTDDLEAKAV